MTTNPSEAPAEHTKEPWKTNDSRRITGESKNGHRVVICDTAQPLLADPIKGATEANAARIVACVNACAGIPAPESAIEQAREALSHAEQTFLRYADLHRAKGTKDGDDKAWANVEEANLVNAALEALSNLTPATDKQGATPAEGKAAL